MRAAFSDPQGPRRWRLAPQAGPLALLLYACLGPIHGIPALLTAGMAVSLAHLVGAISLRQRRLRPSEAVTGPGFIEIKKAGTRTQRIDAKSIVGGTTARTGNGILFTLSHAKRDQPIALEVESEADAERIRHALGIGRIPVVTGGQPLTDRGDIAAFRGDHQFRLASMESTDPGRVSS